ncbi:MAG: YqeG family HAD IIIA-type phosphatase [Eubacteriales bacterium]|nr:YqeG family HAD IIIA-type phosphatase [Eubacteriales bacterium]
MPLSFLPKIIANNLTDLTPELLRARHIRLLMLDFDNTIVPYTTNVPTSEMTEWLDRMNKLEDIQLCIVSNSHKDRVPTFCRERGLPCITYARKPSTKGIRECLSKFSIPASEAALVGDQIYTDTLGANLAGVTSILVSAIDNHNFWLKARHVLELPFIFIARNRRIKP